MKYLAISIGLFILLVLLNSCSNPTTSPALNFSGIYDCNLGDQTSGIKYFTTEIRQSLQRVSGTVTINTGAGNYGGVVSGLVTGDYINFSVTFTEPGYNFMYFGLMDHQSVQKKINGKISFIPSGKDATPDSISAVLNEISEGK